LISVRSSQVSGPKLGIPAKSSAAYNRAFHNLGGRNYLAITGLYGDASVIIRQAKLFVIAYLSEYGNYPSAEHIAQEIGQLIQRGLSTGNRPFAVHAFIIDNSRFIGPTDTATAAILSKPCTNYILEVDTSGAIKQVVAGIAGKDSDRLQLRLEQEYDNNLNATAARAITESLIADAYKNKDDIVIKLSNYVDHFEIFAV
jgi:20S proteasome alpha/beta subunit